MGYVTGGKGLAMTELAPIKITLTFREAAIIHRSLQRYREDALWHADRTLELSTMGNESTMAEAFRNDAEIAQRIARKLVAKKE